MAEEGSEKVLLNCVEVVTGLKLDTISKIIDCQYFNKLITKLKLNFNTPPKTFHDSIPRLRSFIKEYFNSDLVEFSTAEQGNKKELNKLTLLLLYNSLKTDKEVRDLLCNNLEHKQQLKLKYLCECIVKRSSCLSIKYLDVLTAENLDQCKTIKSESGGGSSSGISIPRPLPHGSDVVYSTSPKAAPPQSPLKELLQSPSFRLQRKLEYRNKEMRDLNCEIANLEQERQDILCREEALKQKVNKLETDKLQLKTSNAGLREENDVMQSSIAAGERDLHLQIQGLTRKLKTTKSECDEAKANCDELAEKMDEYTSKIKVMKARISTMVLERDHYEARASELEECTQRNTLELEEKNGTIHRLTVMQVYKTDQALMSHCLTVTS